MKEKAATVSKGASNSAVAEFWDTTGLLQSSLELVGPRISRLPFRSRRSSNRGAARSKCLRSAMGGLREGLAWQLALQPS